MVSAVTPGFVETGMTSFVPKTVKGRGFGTKKAPDEGTQSTRHTLFAQLGGSGWYYGEDSIRSSLHDMRIAGEPAFYGYPKL